MCCYFNYSHGCGRDGKLQLAHGKIVYVMCCMLCFVMLFSRLKCVAAGYPTPQVSWLIDHETVRGELLSASSNRMTFGSYLDRNGDVISHLNLSHVTGQDSSEYACLAKNNLGEVRHSSWLHVYGSPVAKQPRNITAIAGHYLLT